MKAFDIWNSRKKLIENKEFRGYVREREIWWFSLGLNIGDEEDGKNDLFERPVLILKKFNARLVLVVPLTTKVKDSKYYFKFTHRSVIYAAMLSQLRPISTKRLSRNVRRMDVDLFSQISEEIVSLCHKKTNSAL